MAAIRHLHRRGKRRSFQNTLFHQRWHLHAAARAQGSAHPGDRQLLDELQLLIVAGDEIQHLQHLAGLDEVVRRETRAIGQQGRAQIDTGSGAQDFADGIGAAGITGAGAAVIVNVPTTLVML